MKKKIIGFCLLLLVKPIKVLSCTICKSRQPKGFENITHGTGAENDIDYFIICSAIVVVGISLFLSVKYLVRPKEELASHIKNSILESHESQN